MSLLVPRRYEPNPKHKWPKGFGSLCPKKLTTDEAQGLLDSAVAAPEVSTNKLWTVQGQWCFCAHPSGDDVWHGFPVIGGDVDERVWSALVKAGVISRKTAKRLRSQRSLPEDWP
jgi:hypothetical protein